MRCSISVRCGAGVLRAPARSRGSGMWLARRLGANQDGHAPRRSARLAGVYQLVKHGFDAPASGLNRGRPCTMSTPTVPPPLAAGRLSQAEYARNFADAHPPLTPVQALLEAERCYYCYDAPCTTACPTGIDIPTLHRPHRAGQPAWRGAHHPGRKRARRHVRPRLPDRGAVRAGLRAQRAGGQAGGDRPAAAPRHRRAISPSRARRCSRARRPAASAWRWSAPGRPGCPARTGWRCWATR